ncbi:hypothetical protein JVT61DRAFT_2636 [Boletus reticuloceps]|uniref:Uncharacterized protein n=1 Tax=Boletus reticuloceps TaxID=495285 RepID=A0A8I3AAJ7_9AGAM|nr:hypothetical protein JVT61DRAFT_2636 [Boletus reticuloceps]
MLDLELPYTHGKTSPDDDVQGWQRAGITITLLLSHFQAATSSIKECESLLNTGLFTHPNLQAVDVLAYTRYQNT